MKFLSNVHSGKRKSPRRIMIYGVHGIGKSTWATSAPNPIVLATEDGVNDIDVDSIKIESYEELIGAIGELYTEDHKYKTIVIDSAGWADRLVINHVTQKKNVDTINDVGGFGEGYSLLAKAWGEIVNGLEAVRQTRGMNIILVAHTATIRADKPNLDPYDVSAPQLDRRASALLQQWCDEVLFADYVVNIKYNDDKGGKKKARAVGGTERVVYTSMQAAHFAKNRLDLPPTLPLIWSAYAELAGIDTPQEQETAQ